MSHELCSILAVLKRGLGRHKGSRPDDEQVTFIDEVVNLLKTADLLALQMLKNLVVRRFHENCLALLQVKALEVHIVDAVSLRCQRQSVLALLRATSQQSSILVRRPDCHCSLAVIGALSILVLDQAEVGHNWRVKAHVCLFKSL